MRVPIMHTTLPQPRPRSSMPARTCQAAEGGGGLTPMITSSILHLSKCGTFYIHYILVQHLTYPALVQASATPSIRLTIPSPSLWLPKGNLPPTLPSVAPYFSSSSRSWPSWLSPPSSRVYEPSSLRSPYPRRPSASLPRNIPRDPSPPSAWRAQSTRSPHRHHRSSHTPPRVCSKTRNASWARVKRCRIRS